jgi:hypothetical protein
LILLGGHQKTVRAQEIVFVADEDLRAVLGATDFGPFRPWIWVANLFLVDGPGRVSALSMTVISSCKMFEQYFP